MKQSNDTKTQSQDICCSNPDCCPVQTPIKRATEKIGRNAPCPCNSRRKYKKCCGSNNQ
ncbi:SEC-C metal-binding domain-containing protein [Ningiella sp. W23]|uniref:SEC-C metal-binding domain-containing protein n=1 Tax=Ningiella sp. W23 TaxID=3023715 RepID=UPI003757478A